MFRSRVEETIARQSYAHSSPQPLQPGEELFLRESLCRGEADQTLLAVGERTGLVKDDDIEAVCSLKCQAIAY